MSSKCTVDGCGKWSFQGGLCRGHILAPQAATTSAGCAPSPKQPASSPPAQAMPGPARSGTDARMPAPAPPTSHITVQQADENRRADEARIDFAKEFFKPHVCVRNGCGAIRLPQANGSAYEPGSIVFDNATVQAKIDAFAASGCQYSAKKGGFMFMHAPAHEFPSQGVPVPHTLAPNALQLAVAVLDSVAAAQGNAEAQCRLGDMHSCPFLDDTGRNPLFDMAGAAKFYRMAAQQQHVTAQRRLGDLYEQGEGVVRDEGEAVKCYRIAADKGDSQAQFSLGVLLEEGRGVERDEAEACRLYKAAVAQDRESAAFFAAKLRLGSIEAFAMLQDASQAVDAAALADMLQRLGIKYGADLAALEKSDNSAVRGISKMLKPAFGHAFRFAISGGNQV